MATLNLPIDPRTAVWRLTRERLQADATLAGAVETWLTWDGAADSNADLESKRGPALRLYPLMAPMGWYSAESQRAPLVIMVEAAIPGMDVEDILNLQGAIEDALYPPGGAEDDWLRQLTDAGAVTGLFDFVQPLNDPSARAGGGGNFEPIGSLRIDVMKALIR
jgi:hypothetical protein